MPGLGPHGTRYRFGPFELDPAEESLSRSGTRVKLQDLPYRLLVMLVERPGEIVTREEVRQRLWPGNTFVEFDNSLGVAVRKVRDALNDDAETPRYVETLPRRGYRFVAPVTVLNTEALVQPPQAVEIPKATVPADPGHISARKTTVAYRQRYWVVATLTAALVAAAVYGFRAIPRHASTKAEAAGVMPPIRARRSVAVLGFRNLAGRQDDNWLSPAFAEMLNTELGEGGTLRMVSGEDVARAKRDLPVADEESLAKATLARLRKSAGADVVVVGSYTLLPNHGENRIRLDVRLQDTQRGETIAEESVTGDENNLFELASETGAKLRQRLGLNSISPEAKTEARASVPSNQNALRLYAEGQTKLWALDYGHGRDLLLNAVAADPKFPLAHALLSDAWDHLGYRVKARAEAEAALNLSQHLTEEERLQIEGRYQSTLPDWPKAVVVYRKLSDTFPDSLDYGLRLSLAQRWVNPSDSLKTLASLRLLPSPVGDDPRIDLSEASAWVGQDMAKAEAAAKRAIAKGNANGSRFVVGRAYGVLCQIANRSSTADAVSDCENAKQSYIAGGDHNNEARALNDEAGLYYRRGDLTRAEAMWQEAAGVFRQVGDTGGLAATLNNRGDIFLLQGNLDKARGLLEEAIPGYQAISDKSGVALVNNDLGDLSRWKGDLASAETYYQRAKAAAQEMDDKDSLAYVLTGMGDLFTDRGDLPAARKSYEESLALRNGAGEKPTAAETQLALAKLSIEEGHAEQGETAARECRRQFHDGEQADDELASGIVITRALLSQKKVEDGQKEIEADRPLAAKSQSYLNRLEFVLVSAQALSVSDQPQSARSKLEAVLKDARAHGFGGIELETQLLLAHLEARAGHTAVARDQLASLERAARAKGFGLIARKAATRD